MSSSVPIVTVTAEPPPDNADSTPRQILPFIVFGAIIVVVLLGFVFFSVIVSNRQARRLLASRGTEAHVGNDDLRRLEEVVPSGTLQDDMGQVPTREGRSETVCVICLVKLAEGNAVRHLPCQHTFHTPCIDQWFQAKRYTCPICIAPYFVPS